MGVRLYNGPYTHLLGYREGLGCTINIIYGKRCRVGVRPYNGPYTHLRVLGVYPLRYFAVSILLNSL